MNNPMVAQPAGRQIGRTLKALIPLIQSELQQGNSAGQEHYRLAGQMLIEAKDQIGYGGWGRWLTKNFDLSQQTARLYMQWAREHDEFASAGREVPYNYRRNWTYPVTNRPPLKCHDRGGRDGSRDDVRVVPETDVTSSF
jgi:hypothetical protein